MLYDTANEKETIGDECIKKSIARYRLKQKAGENLRIS